MTITCWCIIIFVAIFSFAIGYLSLLVGSKHKVLAIIIPTIITMLTVCACLFYMSTASGKRAMLDQKSEFNNGIDRIINIYTADGELIAKYEGKIDIDMNDGGYIKFDFNGKRYIYYNCFVETIAEIEKR